MKILFITAGDINMSSSRMRAYWVADELRKLGHEADCVQYQMLNNGFENPFPDVWIWQKAINTEWIQTTGGKHYYDACDPTWWWEPKYIRTAVKSMTAVVCSSDALASDFMWWVHDVSQNRPFEKPVEVRTIPDRLNFDHFPKQRQHTAVSPVRFIWFGWSANRIALIGALANLERLAANGYKIELTIMDNEPHNQARWTNFFPVNHVQWNLETENAILASHDVALLPPYPGAWGKVKSNNKRLTAWASGLPVWDGDDYCKGKMLMDATTRANMAYHDELKDYQVAQSAQEWHQLLSEGR